MTDIIPHKDGFIVLEETQSRVVGYYSTHEAASQASDLYTQMLSVTEPMAWIDMLDQLDQIEALPYPTDFFESDEGPPCDDCSCGRAD